MIHRMFTRHDLSNCNAAYPTKLITSLTLHVKVKRKNKERRNTGFFHRQDLNKTSLP